MNNKEVKSRIGSDAIKLTGSKVVTMLIAMISSMLLARFRTLTEYGTYSQLLMAINLVCSIIMLGLPNSINYFLAKAETENERDRFLSVYYTLNTILSFTVGLVLVLAIPLLEIVFKNNLIRSFWYFLAFFPWTKIIMSSVEHLLIVYHKTNTLIIYRIANSVVLLGIILIVQVCGGTFTAYMMLYVAAEAVFTLWTYWQVKRNASCFKPSLDKTLIKTIFAFSIPIGLASIIGTLNIELDKLVITTFFTTEDLAVYTNASKELPVTVISTSLTAVLLPQIVRLLRAGQKKEAVEIWKSATTISFAIICFFAVACFVFAPEVITVLYSEKYLPGVSVFRVYCLVLLLRCTYFGMMLNANGKTKFVLYSSIGSLLLNIVLNYLLYYFFGFIGPALATLISTLIMAIIQLIYSSKVCDIRFSNIFPWKNTFLLLVLNAIIGAIILLLHKFTSGFINPVVSAIILGVVWLLILVIILYKPLLKKWKMLNS
ncbi:MAG: oligosaccharide flippase family protein [Christensenellaceae bacterium]